MVTALRTLGEKARGQLRPGPCITAGDLAQMLADGARGVDQSLPPLPVDRFPVRSRRMFAVTLGAWTARTTSERRRQEQAKRLQRTNLVMRSVRPAPVWGQFDLAGAR